MLYKIKHLLCMLFLVAGASAGMPAQIHDPVSWEVTAQKTGESRYNIIMRATLEEGWHLYSQKQFGEEFEGPIPTAFSYNASPATYTLLGGTQEPGITPIFDAVFNLDVVYFEDEAVFVQPIKIADPEGLKIMVEIFYSVCDDEKCLPPETKTFELGLAPGSAKNATAELSEEDLQKSAALMLDIKNRDAFKSGANEAGSGMLTIFLLGFVGGLLALLT
ncbi:MAG: protein-disulfide reductase DsbD N-terminal domain-containing protein, partial [Marinirhabdus sp.]